MNSMLHSRKKQILICFLLYLLTSNIYTAMYMVFFPNPFPVLFVRDTFPNSLFFLIGDNSRWSISTGIIFIVACLILNLGILQIFHRYIYTLKGVFFYLLGYLFSSMVIVYLIYFYILTY
jgi:hypothetical protein